MASEELLNMQIIIIDTACRPCPLDKIMLQQDNAQCVYTAVCAYKVKPETCHMGY